MDNATKFDEFQKKNPHVYEQLVDMTYQLKKKGNTKIGISMLYEVMRWKSMLQTSGDDYKLNNIYRAYYARKIMDEHPDIDGIFEVRVQKA